MLTLMTGAGGVLDAELTASLLVDLTLSCRYCHRRHLQCDGACVADRNRLPQEQCAWSQRREERHVRAKKRKQKTLLQKTLTRLQQLRHRGSKNRQVRESASTTAA